MSKPSTTPLPVLNVGDRGFAKPCDLSPHAELASHPYDGGTLIQMQGTIPVSGVIEEILITTDRQIVNGRHRWKGAVMLNMATKPCLPYRVVSDDEVDDIILTTLSARKHYSRSAVAYLARPHIEAALLRAAEIRKAHLKEGASRKPTDQSTGANGSSFADIAARLNVSTDLLTLAAKTYQLFKDSDARIQKWLGNDLDMQADWEGWQETNGQDASWTRWREDRLRDMGHNDPGDAKCAAIIPEDYREIYEGKLFSVEPGESMGLGAINKAVGSALATKGGARSDLDSKNPALHVTLGNKLKGFTKGMFAKWQDLGVDHRMELAAGIADATTDWPEEVKAAIVAKFKGGRK
jgi:ParB-like chromosome segregation protein Spo0J